MPAIQEYASQHGCEIGLRHGFVLVTCFEASRCDEADLDSPVFHFVRQRLREHLHCRLGRIVNREEWHRYIA